MLVDMSTPNPELTSDKKHWTGRLGRPGQPYRWQHGSRAAPAPLSAQDYRTPARQQLLLEAFKSHSTAGHPHLNPQRGTR